MKGKFPSHSIVSIFSFTGNLPKCFQSSLVFLPLTYELNENTCYMFACKNKLQINSPIRQATVVYVNRCLHQYVN